MKRLKNIVICAIIAVGLLGLIESSAHAVPVVSIDPDYISITLGNQVNLNVVVDDVLSTNGIIAFGFDVTKPVSWNTVGLPVVGPGFSSKSGQPNYPEVAGYAFPPIYDGDGPGNQKVLLATLSYQPTVSGMYEYSILGNVQELNEGIWYFKIGVQEISASSKVCVKPCVEVQGDPTAVPEPATITLFGIGLLTLAGVGYGYSRRIN